MISPHEHGSTKLEGAIRAALDHARSAGDGTTADELTAILQHLAMQRPAAPPELRTMSGAASG